MLTLTAGASGWPALAFFTADGHAIGATPYGPLRDHDKRRGLARVVVEVLSAWYEERDALLAEGERMRQAWNAVPAIAGQTPRNLLLAADAVAAHAMEAADTIEGGFGPAPRAPSIPLLHYLSERNDPALNGHVEKSRAALIAGGIHDQFAGGFHRASTDASWSIPFFEKRLGDQAQMAALLARHDTMLSQQIAERTLSWTIHHLKRTDGLYAHGLHAESISLGDEPTNSASYAWTLNAIADIVGKDAAHIIWQRYCSDDRSLLPTQNLMMKMQTMAGQSRPCVRKSITSIKAISLVGSIVWRSPEANDHNQHAMIVFCGGKMARCWLLCTR